MSQPQRIVNLAVGGLAVIGLVTLTSWFLTNFERRVEIERVGYSAEARRNSLLAAERFLAKLGVDVESVVGRERLWRLPPTTDTLVVLGLGAMTPDRQAGLASWLEGGGHLVVEAMETWNGEPPADDFVAMQGFELVFELNEDTEEQEAGDDDAVSLARIDASDPPGVVEISFQDEYWLRGRDGDAQLAVVEGRPKILRRAVGRGRITVLSDTVFMTNEAIGEHDHAYFLNRLLRPTQGGKVWLLFDSDMPWLGALLWSLAPFALVSMGLLILVWLWSIGRRLGPLAGPPDRRRRDLIEHLDATGDFLWRQRQTGALVEASRHRLVSDWLRRHPQVAQAQPDAQARALAELTGEQVEQVHRSLFTHPEDAAGFVDQARLLHRLRQDGRRAGRRDRPQAGASARRAEP